MTGRCGTREKRALRILAALLVWAMAAALAPACALGEGEGKPLDIQMAVSPEELVDAGEVMLSFTIENRSDAGVQNVYLSSADGLISEPLGAIAAGEKQSFTRQHSVTEAELQAGEILMILSHDDPDDAQRKVNYAARAAIRRGEARAQAEFTRQFSSRSVAAGGALTIVYRVRNAGNVALTDLRVRDKLGDFTARAERLEAGECCAFVSRVSLTEPAVSSASLSYAAEGGGTREADLEDVEIAVAQAEIELRFALGEVSSSGDAAELVLTLRNVGEADCYDLRVTDELYGGVVADGFDLPAGGEPREIRRRCPIRGEAGFQWRVTGAGTDGATVDLRTETLHPALPATGDAALSLSAAALTPRIRRSGDVTVRVRISNEGGADVRDVALLEQERGLMRNFAVLPAGGVIERDFSFRVTEDSAYRFSIRYVDGEGETQAISAPPAEVVIASDGVLPEGAKPRFIEFSGNSIKVGGSSTFAVLLIAGCVVLLTLIVMLLVASRRARMEKRMRIAAERQRRKEEMGKTNRFTPVRAPKTRNKSKRTE